MRPGTYNIQHYQGDTLLLPIRIRDTNTDGTPGPYESLTGWTGKAQIRSSAAALIEELTVTIDPDQVTNTGLLTVGATHAQTALWTVTNGWVWDLQLTNGAGQVRTILAGTVTITAEVTK